LGRPFSLLAKPVTGGRVDDAAVTKTCAPRPLREIPAGHY
jgi:hypothetical protein